MPKEKQFNRILHTFIRLIPIIGLASCMSPMNLNYESAKTIDKGNVAITPSIETFPLAPFLTSDSVQYPKLNGGLKMTIGTSNKSSFSFHYVNKYNYFEPSFRQHSLELNYKIGIGKRYLDPNHKKKIALGLPVQFYHYFREDSYPYFGFIFNPRFYFTREYERVDLTFIPKAFIVTDEYAQAFGYPLLPGVGASVNVMWKLKNHPNSSVVVEFGSVGLTNWEIGFGMNFQIITKDAKLTHSSGNSKE